MLSTAVLPKDPNPFSFAVVHSESTLQVGFEKSEAFTLDENVPVYVQNWDGLAINLIAFVLHVPCVADQAAVTVSEKKRRAAGGGRRPPQRRKASSSSVIRVPLSTNNTFAFPSEVPGTTTRTGRRPCVGRRDGEIKYPNKAHK
jgi:hypothetical protein